MLRVAIVPEPPRRVIVPTGWKSSVTQSCVPSGSLTFLTWTDRRLKPPQPLNFDMSAVAVPLGVLPLRAGPLSELRLVPPVWQPGGVGAGVSVEVTENVPDAVAPVASVTVTGNVEVPSADGAPSSSPEGRSVSPAGGEPDQVYGGVPCLARKLVEKKLLTKTLLPAPMSQTPPLQVKNWL